MSFDNDETSEDDESQGAGEVAADSDLEADAAEDEPAETTDEARETSDEGREIGDEPRTAGGESASTGGGGKTSGEKFCSNCGSEIDAAAEICPECGVRQGAAGGSDEKDPAIAALLSFVIVGAGQLYNGQIAKGIALHVGMWVAAVVGFLFIWLVIPALIPLAVWGFAVYDAYDQAQKINAGQVSV